MEATIKPAGRRRIITLATAIFTIMIAGVAFAAWTATGTGTGTAKAGTGQEVYTASATASTTSLLYPGGTADVELELRNPNPYPVTVTEINNRNLTTHPIGSGDTPCDASHGVTFADTTGSWLVPANDGTDDGELSVTLADKASMSNASVDECQGETFTIHVELVGASS